MLVYAGREGVGGISDMISTPYLTGAIKSSSFPLILINLDCPFHCEHGQESFDFFPNFDCLDCKDEIILSFGNPFETVMSVGDVEVIVSNMANLQSKD